MLLRQLGEVAKDNSDDLTWLLTSFLRRDAQRRERWSGELARFVVAQRTGNAGVLRKWIDKWSPLADDSAAGLGSLLENHPQRGRAASEVAAAAAAARERLLAGASLGLVSTDPAAVG